MSDFTRTLADTITLVNGTRIPQLGFGTWKLEEASVLRTAVLAAIEIGYRHIDTAAIYGNERYVGSALAESGVPREDVFLTTKCWNDSIRAGFDGVLRGFEESLQRLGTDYVDLYLLHWPIPGAYGDAWRAMETLYERKQARAIGVSNYLPHHLDELCVDATVTPMVNQIEFHPRLLQPELLHANRSRGITPVAWSPLMQGKVGEEAVLREIAEARGKTPAQVVLRWDLQHGVVTIPKSAHPDRIRENAELYDFELSAEEMKRIDGLNDGTRFGADPDHISF